MGLLESLVARGIWFTAEVTGKPAIRYMLQPRPVKDWGKRLNNEFSGEFKVLKESCRQVRLLPDGAFELTGDLKEEAKKQKKYLEKNKYPNDPHAIRSRGVNWYADPVNIYFQTLSYDAVLALRALKREHEVISAGFLIICRETQEILLHHRSRKSETFPDRWHVFGGGYMPQVRDRQDYDRIDLLSTAIRELHEETQIGISRDVPSHCIISKELKTGFIQVVYLGANISKRAIEENKGNWEGNVERISFRNLREVLEQEDKWVPSGRALVLAWLALGAPYAGWRPRFSDLSAKRLFDDLVPK